MRSARKTNPARRAEEGYALLLVFLMAAVIAITLYNEMPRVAFESQRLREQMLVDRGDQYKRAIQLFYRKFHRYPTKMEELENTNNERFLRRRYTDPMTGKDDWRLIHIGPGGVLTDSLVQKQNNPLGDKNGDKNGNSQTANGQQAGQGSNQEASSNSQADPNAPPQVTGLNLAATRRPSDNVNGQPQLPAAPGAPAPDPSYPNQPQLPNQAQLPIQAQLQAVQQAQAVQPGAPNPASPAAPGQPAFPGQVQIGQPVQLQPGQLPTGVPNPAVPGQPVFPAQIRPGQPQPGALRPGQLPPGQLVNGIPVPGRPVIPGQPAAPGQQNPAQPYNPATVNPEIVQPYTEATGPDPAQPVPVQYGLAPTVNLGQPRPQTPAQPSAAGSAPSPAQSQNPALGAIMTSITSPSRPASTTGIAGQSMNTAGIAGVASKYKGPSIKIIDERQKYEEWEFIYDLKKDKTVVGAAAVQQQQQLQNQGGQNQTPAQSGSPFGGSSFGSSSFGTSSGTGSASPQPFSQASPQAPQVYTPPSQ